MRQAWVRVNKRIAGLLSEESDGKYKFVYQNDYLSDVQSDAVSLTLPKRQDPYFCDYLFPCFSNLLSEGANKAMQCTLHHLDPDDEFGLLLATGQFDCAGALTFIPVTK